MADIALSRRQTKCLVLIQQKLQRDGIAPSVRELCVSLTCGKNFALTLLGDLERKGYIRRLPRRARAIEILRPIDAAAETVAERHAVMIRALRTPLPAELRGAVMTGVKVPTLAAFRAPGVNKSAVPG